ncbi:uncharacterized protein KQ657_002644 [Scheffersomyces spartinae]|uniref:Uncharacterized protein n=1 Tax=Scheffersomyces spartinae TaxID=45513 RepID=A0A9P7V5Z4_9ASCO|nr:uncharacterized protein KQ657_002644 [Scheffersomyces spartinae]KAG7191855.1 hypothetical protein KQ657_002644 [Scheffersomyces spartinae]
MLTNQTEASLLSPDNCKSSTRIRAFLRLSRLATDDTIRQHLNEIQPSACNEYFQTVIVPAWKERSHAIEYCSDYALFLRQTSDSSKLEGDNNGHRTESDFDLRTDPYALKNYNEQLQSQYSQCDQIDNWVLNERNIETIIRGLTEEILNQKCYYGHWIEEFKKSLQQ